MSNAKPTTVNEYIHAAPAYTQAKLREMRTLLKEVVPSATEAVKWGSPVFEEKRILFAYTAFKSYISFMPTPSSLEPFKKEPEQHQTTRDTIKFPYDKSLPKALIRKIAQHRVHDVRENDARWTQ